MICKELGFDGGVVVSERRRQLTYDYRYQLWYGLYCEGTEHSIYDCTSRYGYDEFSYSSCRYITEYSCQSKYAVFYLSLYSILYNKGGSFKCSYFMHIANTYCVSILLVILKIKNYK